jgi:hypothetical protein
VGAGDTAMRLLELQDEISDLRKKLEDRDEELKSRQDEVLCLSASLLEKEQLLFGAGIQSSESKDDTSDAAKVRAPAACCATSRCPALRCARVLCAAAVAVTVLLLCCLLSVSIASVLFCLPALSSRRSFVASCRLVSLAPCRLVSPRVPACVLCAVCVLLLRASCSCRCLARP